jgi:hypothetical protein
MMSRTSGVFAKSAASRASVTRAAVADRAKRLVKAGRKRRFLTEASKMTAIHVAIMESEELILSFIDDILPSLSDDEILFIASVLEEMDDHPALVTILGVLLGTGIVYGTGKAARRVSMVFRRNGNPSKDYAKADTLNESDMFTVHVEETDSDGKLLRSHPVSTAIVQRNALITTRVVAGIEDEMPAKAIRDAGPRGSVVMFIIASLVGSYLLVEQIAQYYQEPMMGTATSDVPHGRKEDALPPPLETAETVVPRGRHIWNHEGTVMWEGKEVSTQDLHKYLMARYAAELASVEVLSPSQDRITRLANKGATLYVIQEAINRLERGNVSSYLDVALLTLRDGGEAYESYFSTSGAITRANERESDSLPGVSES